MSARAKVVVVFASLAVVMAVATQAQAQARGPTAVSLTVSAPAVTFGDDVTFVVAVEPSAPGQPVSIVDADEVEIASGSTGQDGTFQAAVEPRENLVVHASSLGVDSTSVDVAVRPVMTLTSGPVRLFDVLAVRGTFRPIRPGLRVTIELQHRGATVATKRPAIDARGRFHAAFQVLSAGSYRVKAVLDAPDLLPGRAATAPFVTPLPDLANGSRGVYVGLLEHRLVALHYHLAGVDDVFDFRTADAVMAFRKVQRMPRTQNVDAAVWRALGSPRLFAPRNHDDGFHIEVDQTRQVLATVRDGRVVDIIHVSTGKPSTPTHDGSFHVFSKLAGFSQEHLYYPSFFDGERAIHGWTDVPSYAASHGCVRVPYWIATWIYRFDPIGTPVLIYH